MIIRRKVRNEIKFKQWEPTFRKSNIKGGDSEGIVVEKRSGEENNVDDSNPDEIPYPVNEDEEYYNDED